jgi:hypothetical protein
MDGRTPNLIIDVGYPLLGAEPMLRLRPPRFAWNPGTVWKKDPAPQTLQTCNNWSLDQLLLLGWRLRPEILSVKRFAYQGRSNPQTLEYL